MEKEVLIHVKGLHMMDTPEGDEPIEIVVPGEYYFRNGSHYLRYEEMLDEQGDPTINYIKISSCLLYTSPSPRDRQKSRMPSSA